MYHHFGLLHCYWYMTYTPTGKAQSYMFKSLKIIEFYLLWMMKSSFFSSRKQYFLLNANLVAVLMSVSA